MTCKVLLMLGLAAAIGLMPLAAVAHEGHDHGVKAKKVKKSKPKKGAVEFILRRETAGLRVCVGARREKNRQLSRAS